MGERHVAKDSVARLDLMPIEKNFYKRHVFLQNAAGEYIDLTGYLAEAPVRASRDGEPVADISEGIVTKVAPDGVERTAVLLLMSSTETHEYDRHFWQLDLVDTNTERRTRVAGQILTQPAQQ